MNESQLPLNPGLAPLSAATTDNAEQSTPPRPRLWPLPVIVILMWVAVLGAEWLAPATVIHFYAGFFGPFLATLASVAWWVLASRLPWKERWLGLLLFVVVGAAGCLLAHPSFAGIFVTLYALPAAITVMAVWLVITPFLLWPVRRFGLLVMLLGVWVFFLLVRYEGVTGSFAASLPWRWSLTDEERFLAERGNSQPRLLEGTATLEPGDWPAFRGKDRDGRLTGVRIATDWDQRPPKLLWRHRVGPGWSSFADDWQAALHAGATGRKRSGRLLRRRHRRGSVGA